MATVDSITNPDKMFTDGGINVIVDRVTQADGDKKTVTLSDGREIPYDKLLLGIGATPAVLAIEGHELDGVFSLRSAPDAEKIKNFLEQRKAKKLVLIGAGFTNLEVATLLCETKPEHYEVTVIEILGYPLPLMVDSDMGAHVQEHLVEKGFTMKMDEKVTRILGQNGVVSGVELASGETIEADMVLLAVGVRQNLELAKDLGLELGKFGIKVNKFLETSVPDVMAAGDCVEKYNLVTKKPVPGQLRGPAVIQGRLAAKRLAGYEIEFPGVLNNSAVRLFDKYIGSVGLTEEEARREGIEALSTTVNSRSKHGMIPGVLPWTLKLVFDRVSHRVIGGQIISDSVGPVKEIDTINALILGEKTIPELTTLMCAGNPDCSSEPSLEPITICAEQALQKLRN
ncbi:MAG: FAD-dependent oxidoreductase [Deltaproteobacteria bacterium]|nr:FAD-dependent oxidoreductase [Deltaproteobacteria bacterium]